jgi:hypothetical protein
LIDFQPFACLAEGANQGQSAIAFDPKEKRDGNYFRLLGSFQSAVAYESGERVFLSKSWKKFDPLCSDQRFQ